MYDNYTVDMNDRNGHTYFRIESNDKNRIWWNWNWWITIISYDARIYLVKGELAMKWWW